MECSCAIDVYADGDGPDIYSERTLTAKKIHRCTECRREIQPGETYEKITGRWEKWLCFKTCSDCLSLRNEFYQRGYDLGEVRAGIYDFINEAGGDIPETCIAQLTPAARAFVCDIIEGIWGDNDYDGDFTDDLTK